MKTKYLPTTVSLAFAVTLGSAWALQISPTSQRLVGHRAQQILTPWTPPAPTTPHFAPTPDFELAGSLIADLEAADFNGDGFMDVIAMEGTTPRIFLGNAAGNLVEVPGTVPGLQGGHLIHGDWNEDGKPDLGTAWEITGETPQVRLYLNTTP